MVPRCFGCKASDPGELTCRRCGSDLGLVNNVVRAAALCLRRSSVALCEGDYHGALQEAQHARRLHDTAAARSACAVATVALAARRPQVQAPQSKPARGMLGVCRANAPHGAFDVSGTMARRDL